MSRQPWASGPREILEHALDLFKEDSDRNRRLALLAIDNSVELMIKTFLGLPKRVSGLDISRKKTTEAFESFPKLLDALEEYAADRLDGIDLGEIEWFHRLRNQLYHQGNGLTVDHEKVDIYSELAQLLFSNLFGDELGLEPDARHESLGKFLAEWVELERAVGELTHARSEYFSTLRDRPVPPFHAISELSRTGLLGEEDVSRLQELRTLRNRLVHGMEDYRNALTVEVFSQLESITHRIRGLARERETERAS